MYNAPLIETPRRHSCPFRQEIRSTWPIPPGPSGRTENHRKNTDIIWNATLVSRCSRWREGHKPFHHTLAKGVRRENCIPLPSGTKWKCLLDQRGTTEPTLWNPMKPHPVRQSSPIQLSNVCTRGEKIPPLRLHHPPAAGCESIIGRADPIHFAVPIDETERVSLSVDLTPRQRIRTVNPTARHIMHVRRRFQRWIIRVWCQRICGVHDARCC